MEIFGVCHSSFVLEETLRRIDEQLEHRVPSQVLVELPTNYDQLVNRGIARKGTFFDTIASSYHKRGSAIIYGDRELILPDRPLSLAEVLLPEYFFDSDERDEFMVKQIREKKPNVVILGVGHTEIIAPMFPQASYVVFHHDLWARYDRIRSPQAHRVVRLVENS